MKKLVLSVILIASLFGCSSNAKTSSNVSTASSPQTTSNVVTQTEKIKFKTEGGTDLFSLKQQADGAKLVDGNEKEFAIIKIDESGKVKIKNASEKVLGYVVAEKGYWKIENPEQNKELYILRRANNTEYQLEDAAKKQVYQIKARNNGFEIETPDKKLVYKIKVKEGKTSLRDASDKTVFSTKSVVSPIAFACFGLDVLTREQQAGLAYAVNSTKGQ